MNNSDEPRCADIFCTCLLHISDIFRSEADVSQDRFILSFWENSIMSRLICILNKHVQVFPFLHVFASICFLKVSFLKEDSGYLFMVLLYIPWQLVILSSIVGPSAPYRALLAARWAWSSRKACYVSVTGWDIRPSVQDFNLLWNQGKYMSSTYCPSCGDSYC